MKSQLESNIKRFILKVKLSTKLIKVLWNNYPTSINTVLNVLSILLSDIHENTKLEGIDLARLEYALTNLNQLVDESTENKQSSMNALSECIRKSGLTWIR